MSVLGPCILWTGARSRNGYGNVCRNRKWIGAHRMIYEECFGPIPARLCVLHRCDVRLCINPAHLFLGTHRDNSQDMAIKGRAPDARLTPQDVLAIRARRAAGETITSLGREFGVSNVSISHIARRRTWTWIA